MNILVIDPLNVALSFVWRCHLAGHTVRWFTKDSEVGTGFKGVEKISNWIGSVMWADLVFATSSEEYVDRFDFFRKKGAKIFAATPDSVKLKQKEDNSQIFYTIEEAQQYIMETKSAYGIKSGGLSYEATSAADLLNWMAVHDFADSLTLTPAHAEPCITVSRWMGADGWVGSWCEAICGASGCIAAFPAESRLSNETLGKIEADLRDAGHLGIVTVECHVDGNVKQESLSVSPQWPLFNLILGATKGDPAKWMLDAVNGVDSVKFSDHVGTCVQSSPVHQGSPVYGVTRGNRKHLHPQDMRIDLRYDMDGTYVVARPLWNVVGKRGLTVTGYGKDVRQASERARKTIKQLKIQGSGFNEHFGDELAEYLPAFHERGYVTSLQYESKVKQ